MSEPVPSVPKTVSGSTVVIVMFLLGIVATAALWVYWTKHLEPFMPLQTALNKTFKDAGARVEGGQRKLHQGTPRVLSIRMRIPFDPNLDENQQQVQNVVDECQRLAELHVRDMQFEQMVVVMYFQVKEKGASQKKVEVSLQEPTGSEG